MFYRDSTERSYTPMKNVYKDMKDVYKSPKSMRITVIANYQRSGFTCFVKYTTIQIFHDIHLISMVYCCLI